MAGHDKNRKCDIGLIGLGVMGRNFAQNMADHGFSVAGYDRDTDKMQTLTLERTRDQDLRTGHDIKEFLGLLSQPRAVMMLVPAGDPVDAVIEELLPHLEPGDLVIDSGNSRFTDTNRRIRRVEDRGLSFMGMGMSGGKAALAAAPA